MLTQVEPLARILYDVRHCLAYHEKELITAVKSFTAQTEPLEKQERIFIVIFIFSILFYCHFYNPTSAHREP